MRVKDREKRERKHREISQESEEGQGVHACMPRVHVYTHVNACAGARRESV